MASYDSEGVLPGDGLLSFFYDAVTQGAWGFDPADHGSAAVIYTSTHASIEQCERPEDLSDDGVFQASEWRLLLQIDSDDQASMMWGDVGRIYYWIKQSDLLSRDWDLSWLILQCS